MVRACGWILVMLGAIRMWTASVQLKNHLALRFGLKRLRGRPLQVLAMETSILTLAMKRYFIVTIGVSVQ